MDFEQRIRLLMVEMLEPINEKQAESAAFINELKEKNTKVDQQLELLEVTVYNKNPNNKKT